MEKEKLTRCIFMITYLKGMYTYIAKNENTLHICVVITYAYSQTYIQQHSHHMHVQIGHLALSSFFCVFCRTNHYYSGISNQKLASPLESQFSLFECEDEYSLEENQNDYANVGSMQRLMAVITDKPASVTRVAPHLQPMPDERHAYLTTTDSKRQLQENSVYVEHDDVTSTTSHTYLWKACFLHCQWGYDWLSLGL